MRLTGTNPEYTRSFNRRVVLEAVRLHGPLSRADIARMTGLSAQAISNIADQLRGDGLLIEKRRRDGSRGQPPLALALNPAGGHTLGLSLDHDRLVVALVDLAGSVCATRHVALASTTPATVLRLIEQTVAKVIKAAAVERRRVLGAGLIVPALFEQGNLVSFGPTGLPGLEGLPLADLLSRRLDMPVLVENDATAAAIGEHLYGLGKGLRDFVYIYFGTGLGSGIFVAGQPYRGASGKAGELGHVIVEPGGRPCPCGNRGCLERYVSLSAAMVALRRDGDEAPAIDRDELVRRLAQSDAALRDWLALAARHLRTAIAMIENLFEPQTIIMGGLIPDALLDAMMAQLEPLLPSISSRPGRPLPRLLKAKSERETPTLGAAALPLFQSLAPHLGLVHGVQAVAVEAANPSAAAGAAS
jgi:predicted NBD/HSP70 family sugar kinase/biotin operon repressor